MYQVGQLQETSNDLSTRVHEVSSIVIHSTYTCNLDELADDSRSINQEDSHSIIFMIYS